MMSNALQIGFCENGAGYGGAVISLAAFLEILPAGFQARIYTGIGSAQYQALSRLGRWRQLAPAALVDPGWLKARAIPFASSIDNLCNVLPTALRYLRAFRQDKVQLVYLNNDASCNMAAALAARMAGLPLVLHARGFHADTRGNRWVLSQLTHCIAVSHAVRNELLALGLPAARCTVVAEGLNLDLFKPRPPERAVQQELGVQDGQPVITLVGGLIDWKGQDVLLDAAPAILARYPQAQILLVGSAYGKDDSFAAAITRRARDPLLGGRVRLLGARQDIPAILSVSTIVLHASTKPEPFGRTFLEGMAMGKPVIASNEGGPLDVIAHEVDGLLLPPRDAAALAGAVTRLIGDPDLAQRLARNAADKALAYSIERHAGAIGTILRAAMAGAA